MLLSCRPSGSKLFYSTALLALSALAFLYHFWDLGNRIPHRLHHAEPLLPPTIPKKIWYKLGPNGLNGQTREWTDSCVNSNPDYQAEFVTDLWGDDYVVKAFASRPDIVETYLGLTIPILKADILRYLLLFDQGGIWSDLDVSCEGIPMDEWIPPQYRNHAGLVVGWEFDVGWGENIVRQFATWTIMAKPGLPHISMVIDDILEESRAKMAEFNVSLADLTLPMLGDVVDFTGPRRFTRSVLKSAELILNTTIPISTIANLIEPKVVGDLLIMPGNAFAASSNTYREKEDPGPPLVTHHYAGTWKNNYGGEQS